MRRIEQRGGIAARVTELVGPTAAGMGYTLWDVEFVREAGEYYLRITLDRDGGINIDDCERFHRAVDPMLDEADYIKDAYNLEVSSPGIERELKTPAHFAAFIGHEVEVRLYAPREGKKKFRGVLRSYGGDGVGIDCGDSAGNGGVMLFARDEVAKVRTVFDFGGVK